MARMIEFEKNNSALFGGSEMNGQKEKQKSEEKARESVLQKADEFVAELEKEIGVPEKFTSNLLKLGNDWSFVIILHSFIEAALTQLIIKALGKDELEDMMGELEMKKKIKCTKSLKLLTKEARRFIHMLSEIRNIFVHNIKSISLNLPEYVKSLNRDKLNNFVEAVRYGIKEQLEINGDKVERDDFIKSVPRVSMWLCAYSVIAEIGGQLGIQILEQKREESLDKIEEMIISFVSEKIDSSQ